MLAIESCYLYLSAEVSSQSWALAAKMGEEAVAISPVQMDNMELEAFSTSALEAKESQAKTKE